MGRLFHVPLAVWDAQYQVRFEMRIIRSCVDAHAGQLQTNADKYACVLRRNAYDVESMAHAGYRSQLLPMRTYMLAACMQPNAANDSLCHPDNIKTYVDMIQVNAGDFRERHVGLYLGEGKTEPFSDPRLYVSAAVDTVAGLCQGKCHVSAVLSGSTCMWMMPCACSGVGSGNCSAHTT
jgi:hypothetical protein